MEEVVVDYYNEFEKYPAQWLRNLVDAGHIPKGAIDERDIRNVNPEEIKKYKQAHFFAGIGGWPYALRLAGWPEDRPVWTGSCPCQPFSNAGKGKGVADERHLWPAFRWLIAQCRPPVIFGEQVASKAGRGWLTGVRADLEALGYEVGCADLCAAGAGAPHIRQRLFWVGYAQSDKQWGSTLSGKDGEGVEVGGSGRDYRVANSEGKGPQVDMVTKSEIKEYVGSGNSCGLGQSNGPGPQSREQTSSSARHGSTVESASGDSGVDDSMSGRNRESEEKVRTRGKSVKLSGKYWSDFYLISCADGKQRRVKSGIRPLAHGISGRLELVRTRIEGGSQIQETHTYSRVGSLRGLGNAIVPQIAALFIKSVMEV